MSVMFKQIVVATDFSEVSQHALELAVDIASRFNAQLTLVHSWEAPAFAYGGGITIPIDWVTPIQQAAEARLEQTLQELRLRLPTATASFRCGLAWEEILAAASEVGADLLVLGTHGRRGLSRALLGSVAEKVVRLASVPVLTVHEPEESDALTHTAPGTLHA